MGGSGEFPVGRIQFPNTQGVIIAIRVCNGRHRWTTFENGYGFLSCCVREAPFYDSSDGKFIYCSFDGVFHFDFIFTVGVRTLRRIQIIRNRDRVTRDLATIGWS